MTTEDFLKGIEQKSNDVLSRIQENCEYKIYLDLSDPLSIMFLLCAFIGKERRYAGVRVGRPTLNRMFGNDTERGIFIGLVSDSLNRIAEDHKDKYYLERKE